MSVKGTPIEIHPQRCYACAKELRDGEKAVASVNLPLAFCLACRGEKARVGGELVPAVVKAESGG